MYNKKGMLIPTLGTLFIVIIIIFLAFVGIFSSYEESGIAQRGGKAISLSDYSEFWKKSLEESLQIISKRTAYDLGKIGGIYGMETALWNNTYPSMDILKEQLESRIEENLPQRKIRNGKTVNWENGYSFISYGKNRLDGDADYDGDVDQADADICMLAVDSYPGALNWNPNCDFNEDNYIDIEDFVIIGANMDRTGGPSLATSKSFILKGNKNFSISDESIDSTIFANHNFNLNISSSYFKLLFIGRKILEDNSYYSLLVTDRPQLENKLKNDFNIFSIITLSGDYIEVSLTDNSCLPEYYCLAPLTSNEPKLRLPSGKVIPYNFLSLNFKVYYPGLGGFIEVYAYETGNQVPASVIVIDEGFKRRGDLNHDGIIDVFDNVAVTGRYGETVPPAPPAIDLNHDGIIDILDAIIITSNYDKKAPKGTTYFKMPVESGNTTLIATFNGVTKKQWIVVGVGETRIVNFNFP